VFSHSPHLTTIIKIIYHIFGKVRRGRLNRNIIYIHPVRSINVKPVVNLYCSSGGAFTYIEPTGPMHNLQLKHRSDWVNSKITRRATFKGEHIRARGKCDPRVHSGGLCLNLPALDDSS